MLSDRHADLYREVEEELSKLTADWWVSGDLRFGGLIIGRHRSGVMLVGRSSSLPLWKMAPARKRATSSGALTLR